MAKQSAKMQKTATPRMQKTATPLNGAVAIRKGNVAKASNKWVK